MFAWSEESMSLTNWIFATGLAVGIGLLIVGLGDAGKYLCAKLREDS
jgi:hypothetical protein